jgi:hypothetical protein
MLARARNKIQHLDAELKKKRQKEVYNSLALAFPFIIYFGSNPSNSPKMCSSSILGTYFVIANQAMLPTYPGYYWYSLQSYIKLVDLVATPLFQILINSTVRYGPLVHSCACTMLYFRCEMR